VEKLTEQLALPIELERLNAPTKQQLEHFLDRWRGVEGVRVLVSHSDVVVVPAGAELDVDERTGLYRL